MCDDECNLFLLDTIQAAILNSFKIEILASNSKMSNSSILLRYESLLKLERENFSFHRVGGIAYKFRGSQLVKT